MIPTIKNHLLQQDRRYVWHPFTQMKDYAEDDHLLIERAEGIFLYDADGNRYYDTVSSWWVNVHGHCHPKIQQAISEQLQRLDHVMFSGMTHQPGIELAEKLVRITPDGLERVFYSDNGSTAVEVALKMSFQYWQHKGKRDKTTFAYMENSYHGDTLGAVSVGGVELFHSTFKPLLFAARQVPSPNPYGLGNGTSAELDPPERNSTLPGRVPPTGPSPAQAAREQRAAAAGIDAVRRLFEADAETIAALIVEPMIQAAGGMIMYPAAYLAGVRELCTQYGVHLIADEVAVGFGRTGRMFACEHAGVKPDMLCMSKGLTAGVMPMAATLCTEDIYQAFYDDYETFKTFFHGHSFTGNPLAAAVALANLRIFEEDSVLNHVESVSPHLAKHVQEFDKYKQVGNIRHLGMVAAFDLFADKAAKTKFDLHKRAGYQLYLEGLKNGLILRPLGDTVYFWLPLCTTADQIDEIMERTKLTMHSAGIK